MKHVLVKIIKIKKKKMYLIYTDSLLNIIFVTFIYLWERSLHIAYLITKTMSKNKTWIGEQLKMDWIGITFKS